MKVGVLGGTFDPIHNGHVGIAAAAYRTLGLSCVLFVPARDPWLKGGREIVPSRHRIEMVKLAIAADSHYYISYVDLRREGPSYTVDTLSDLKNEYGAGADLYFILGMDAMAGLPSWKDPERITVMCHLVVAKRPGAAMIDLKSMEIELQGLSDKVIVIDNDLYDIDSTEIRRRVAKGISISGLVPDTVARYIQERDLYRKEV